MSKRDRVRLYARYNALYETVWFESKERNSCFYCGDIADTVDHCPPLSWIESKSIKDWVDRYGGFKRVASCGDCNKRIGDKPLFTFEERVLLIENALLEEYGKKMSLWHQDEIDQMSPMFQKIIMGKKERLSLLLDRVRHAQWRVVHLEEVEEV